jgi:hypothetical protein
MMRRRGRKLGSQWMPGPDRKCRVLTAYAYQARSKTPASAEGPRIRARGVCEDITGRRPDRAGGGALLDEATMMWFRLRARRAGLPPTTKLSETTGRKQTFAAAMAQFEEQFTAAKVVTDFTRPVNLYYGLAQAGMAISAAHAPDPWSFSRHGLRLTNREGELANMTVVPEGEGGFQKVSEGLRLGEAEFKR